MLRNIHQRRGVLRIQSDIQKGNLHKNSQHVSAINYFHGKLHPRRLTDFQIRLLKTEKMF